MAFADVIAQVDAEIAKLEQAKLILSGGVAPKSGRGRPKGSKNAAPRAGAAVSPKAKTKRKIPATKRKTAAKG